MNSPISATETRLWTRVLSDFLRGELAGSLLEWARYEVGNAKRFAVAEKLRDARYIEVNSGRAWLRFNGLISLTTKEARRLMADCGKVFAALLSQYEASLNDPVPLLEVARRSKLSGERTIRAINFLNRDSAVSVGLDSPSLTLDSAVSPTNSFVREKSFRQMVKKTREMLKKHSTLVNQPPPSSSQTQSDSKLFADELCRLGCEEVIDAWNKCYDRVDKDTEGALTAAKSLAESACKQILDRRQVMYSKSADFHDLYGLVSKEIQLDPKGAANDSLRQILRGCITVVNGLVHLRNTYGDSHGKAPGSGKPSQRHARLAVSVAGAISAFILSTDDGRSHP